MDQSAAMAVRPAGLTEGAPQVVLRGLSKRFVLGRRAIAALEGITLTIAKGEFCCLVGPSGCGKTTLLRIIAGLERHSEGEMSLLRYEPTKPLNAMVFQEQSIFPWMTVENNVAFGLDMRRISKAERQDRIDYYIDKVGLTRSAKPIRTNCPAA